MSPRWKFFCAFFCVHLIASMTYSYLSGQPGSGSLGTAGAQVGLFGGILFLLSSGRPMAPVAALPLLLVLDSAITAGVATGIFLLVQRLRAA